MSACLSTVSKKYWRCVKRVSKANSEPHAPTFAKPHTTFAKPHTAFAKPHTAFAKPHTAFAKPHTAMPFIQKPHAPTFAMPYIQETLYTVANN